MLSRNPPVENSITPCQTRFRSIHNTVPHPRVIARHLLVFSCQPIVISRAGGWSGSEPQFSEPYVQTRRLMLVGAAAKAAAEAAPESAFADLWHRNVEPATKLNVRRKDPTDWQGPRLCAAERRNRKTQPMNSGGSHFGSERDAESYFAKAVPNCEFWTCN